MRRVPVIAQSPADVSFAESTLRGHEDAAGSRFEARFLDFCSGRKSGLDFCRARLGLGVVWGHHAPFPPALSLARGSHVPRWANRLTAGLVSVVFTCHCGAKTCSFSPGEKVRMRGKGSLHVGPIPALPITNVEEPGAKRRRRIRMGLRVPQWACVAPATGLPWGA